MASLWGQQIVDSRSWFVHRKQLSGKRKVLIQTSWLKESSTRPPWEGEIVDITEWAEGGWGWEHEQTGWVSGESDGETTERQYYQGICAFWDQVKACKDDHN